MQNPRLARIVASLVFGICVAIPVAAQKSTLVSGGPSYAPPVLSRVVEHIDDSRLVKLTGNTHPMARSAFDQGLVEPSRRLERMMMLLQRSPEQQRALDAFNVRQYDPKSPDYHHWLHAEEFGRLYGPSDSDVASVTSWLQNHGFEIYKVSKGRVTIEFSGSAQQVQEAFHTEMHRYLVNGEQHIANDRDPQIPEALAPVVGGIASLHDFFHKPQSMFGRLVKKDLKTGKITDMGPARQAIDSEAHSLGVTSAQGLRPSRGPEPQLTYTTTSGGFPHEDLTPYDFATIYNILPAWNSKVLGTGVSIAISGVSDIDPADVTAFRKTFGLSGFSGTFVQKANGKDPGADGGGGQGENTLDVEMAGATAPNANIIMIVSANSATTGGDELSDSYIIDNEVAPIMTASYGECELGLGQAGNATINAIWQQGMTAGISIFESSGDQGSAGCSNSDAQGPTADSTGLQVNGIASSPYLTAVGGTDFTWSFISGGAAKYWITDPTKEGAQLQTALGYMPEVPWNSTCTNPLVYPLFTDGFTSSEQFCNAIIGGSYAELIHISAGSGGVSHCTTGGTTEATCTGGYAKPTWQTASTPADKHRDLPDVSLFASAGFPDGIVGSAILDCDASSGSPEKTCDYSNPSYIIYQEIGGTSASSPLMAGIMALVLQKTGSGQGLANPVLYSLYGKQVQAGTACDSSTVTNASKCVFNDISSGTIAQVCLTGDPDCVTNTSGDQVGILSGYPATKGYDLAVGLGSVNVTNLVNAWPVTSTLTVTVSPANLGFSPTTVGTATAAQVVTIKNTGTTAVTLTSETITGTNATSFVKSATTCTASLAVGASCTVSIEFKPTVAGSLGASLSIADNVTGSPQTVGLTGEGNPSSSLTVSVLPATLTYASTAVGVSTANQIVTIKNTGTAAVTLTSETITGTNATSFAKTSTSCTTSLAAAASCTVAIAFKPTVTGSLTASLSVADNATGSPQSVTLHGTATPSSLTVSVLPATLTYASTAVGVSTGNQVVTIKNTSATAVTLTSETITGTNATSFSKSSTTCTASLAASASCTVAIAFKPTVAGSLTASLSVVDNASGSPQSVTLTGTGTASTASVTLTPASIAFPATITGSTSDAQVVTLANTGSVSVTISAIALGGTNATSFVNLSSCGATLAASASCQIYVAFKPASAAALTGFLSVTTSASTTPLKVTLTGTGSTAPSVKLSVTSVAFPTTKVGVTTAPKAITLTNNGVATLNLSSITLTGTNATSFVELDTCPATLAHLANCTVYVAFKPTTTGAQTAALTIVDNGAASPQTITLTGTGN